MSVVNKRQLAEIFDVSQRTLTDWQQKGMPIRVLGDRGTENQYDTAAVIEWHLQRRLAGEKQESSRERLERLQADRIEMELAREAGAVVDRDDVEPLFAGAVVAARSTLLSMRNRLKAAIDSCYSIDMDPALIDRHVDEALARLADHDVTVDEMPDVDAIRDEPEDAAA